MSNILSRITIIWIIAILLLFVTVVALWFFYFIHQDGVRSSQVYYQLRYGTGVREISKELEARGVITSPLAFTAAVMIQGRSTDLQSGDYIIPATASISEIIDLFVSGEAEQEVSVTILEGWTNDEIGSYLNRVSPQLISMAKFLEDSDTTDIKKLFPDMEFPALADKPATQNLQGYLYPDTYRLFKNALPKDLILKMLVNFESKLNKEDREAIKAQGKTIFDVLTLASIVEGEEMKEGDMPKVAGVFWKRLSIGMPLQSDATVNYVTRGKRRQPTYEDLQVDSPYNTYKYNGLPPGPIGNPSIAAIRATIHYEQTEYLYFLHTKDGTTIYSRTAEEHAANKAKYLD